MLELKKGTKIYYSMEVIMKVDRFTLFLLGIDLIIFIGAYFVLSYYS